MQKEYVFEKLISTFSNFVSKLKDKREGNNLKYKVYDAVISAFSIFFLQNPSFLSSQVELERRQGRNNANSIFGIHEIPSSNQIRNILDPIPANIFYDIYFKSLEALEHSGILEKYKVLDNKVLISLDGTSYYSSTKICCEKCSTKEQNGIVHYSHSAVTPAIVAPGNNTIIPLVHEFIEPQDGHNKQDCEMVATKRWFKKYGEYFSNLGSIIIADDLYSRQPILSAIKECNIDFIVVCKPSSHKSLYSWIEGLEPEIVTESKSKKVKGKTVTEIFTYKFVNKIPLKDSDDSIYVNWCEILQEKNGKIVYKNSYVTNLPITKENVKSIAVAGRTRWKIENEHNNVLKTKGYNLEHNFGHGQEHLSQTLFTLNRIAFLFHTVLYFQDELYKKLRVAFGALAIFFQHVSSLSTFLVFDSWSHLLDFMWTGLHKKHTLPRHRDG